MVAVMQTNVNFDLETELKAHLNYFIQQNKIDLNRKYVCNSNQFHESFFTQF